MIPPDYTALADEARWQAFCWPLKCEKFLQMADALALAASLQDEKEVLIADFKREELAWSAALDKSKAENQRLQDEIERLKAREQRVLDFADRVEHNGCKLGIRAALAPETGAT